MIIEPVSFLPLLTATYSHSMETDRALRLHDCGPSNHLVRRHRYTWVLLYVVQPNVFGEPGIFDAIHPSSHSPF